MAIQVNCSCGRTCNFPDPQAGQTARCVYCGQILNIPQIGAAAPHSPGAPAKPADDLNLQMSQPSQHVASSGGPARPAPRPISAKPSAPVQPMQAPGVGLGRIIFWGVTGAVVLLVVFGIYSLVHWWNMSEYEGYLAGGDDWMAKGYLTDAEINFKKAQTLFPKDARTADAFKRLAQAEEDRKRNPRSVNAIMGPIAAPGMMPPEAQQRLLQAQQMMNQAQALQQSRQREIERRVREEQEGPQISAQILEARKKRDEAMRKAEEARRKAEAAIASPLNQPVPQKQETKPQATPPTPTTQVAEPDPAVKSVQNTTDTRTSSEARNQKAEEQQLKDAAARKAREEESLKRENLVVLGQLTAWSTSAIQEIAPKCAVSTSWVETRDADRLAATARQAIAEAGAEDVTAPPAAILRKIEDIQDGSGLAEFSKSLPRLILQAEEAVTAGRGAKTVARNQIDMSLRNYDRLVQQETPLKTQYGADAMKKREALAAEKEKLGAKLKDQCAAYLKGLNDLRAAKAGKEQLLEAKKLCAARLQALGVDTSAATSTTPSTPAAPPKVKVYVLKDGTEIKAVTVGAMGDQLLIKDDAGKMHTIEKADVKEIK